MDFDPLCELCLTVLLDSQVCCCFWAVLSAKSSVTVLSAKQLLHFKVQMASSCHNSSTSTLVPPLGIPFNTILCFSDNLAARNRPATELVILKVCNVKLSFDIWLVLYMYFILYSWQYPPFKACGLHMKVILIAAPKVYAMCHGLRALTVLWGF